MPLQLTAAWNLVIKLWAIIFLVFKQKNAFYKFLMSTMWYKILESYWKHNHKLMYILLSVLLNHTLIEVKALALTNRGISLILRIG